MTDLKDAIEVELGWSVELSAQISLLERLSQERFDLIVADLMIHSTSSGPDGEAVQNVHYDDVNWRNTGLEFLRKLRAGAYSADTPTSTPPTVPVVVLSAVADESVMQDIHNGISKHCAEKPFRLEPIIELIRTLGEGSGHVE
jgi:CheY-like chemotaxis protein